MNLSERDQQEAQETQKRRVAELKNELRDQHLELVRYKRIFESIPDGVVCTNSAGRIVMVNRAMETLFGYERGEIIDRQAEFLFYSRKDYLMQFQTKLNQQPEGRYTVYEAKLRKKDGKFFIAEIVHSIYSCEAGEDICFITLLRDITKRKELEWNLRQQEIKFRTVADYASNMECWTHSDGSFLYVSPSSYRITGYKASEFMDNPSLFDNIILPEDKIKWEEHNCNSNKKINLRDLQFRIVRRDGQVRWIEHSCQVVIGNNDDFLGYRSSNQDITQRKIGEEKLQRTLSEIASYQTQLEAERAYQHGKIKLSLNHDNIIGSSNALEYVLYKIEQIAATDTSVLLLGETGTGKELFARAIHKTSLRKDRLLIKVNCAALSANLIESELFGHEKGSFTSAHTRQIGRFELADKATIFLDEIGEIPMDLQAKLLRVLQEGEFERIGGKKTLRVDVRVIAATNCDLEEDVKNGRFRKDLWYRLNVFPITAPPLRERIEDIPQLASYFMEFFASQMKKKVTAIPAKVMQQLQDYTWPGNVRELENIIERAVINSSGSKLNIVDKLKSPDEELETNFQSLEAMERSYILKTLKKTNWKVSGKNSAAEILGLQRSTLRAKIAKHKISKP